MSEKILLVDDEPLVLDGLVRLIGREFNLSTAAGGEEALVKLESSGPYAVVVADMRMAGMDGLKLLEEVRSRFPLTVRMMLTGFDERQIAESAVDQGRVFHYLTKPCSRDSLSSALLAGLELYRLEGQISQISQFLKAS